jgi:hypothetical protein
VTGLILFVIVLPDVVEVVGGDFIFRYEMEEGVSGRVVASEAREGLTYILVGDGDGICILKAGEGIGKCPAGDFL